MVHDNVAFISYIKTGDNRIIQILLFKYYLNIKYLTRY